MEEIRRKRQEVTAARPPTTNIWHQRRKEQLEQERIQKEQERGKQAVMAISKKLEKTEIQGTRQETEIERLRKENAALRKEVEGMKALQTEINTLRTEMKNMAQLVIEQKQTQTTVIEHMKAVQGAIEEEVEKQMEIYSAAHFKRTAEWINRIVEERINALTNDKRQRYQHTEEDKHGEEGYAWVRVRKVVK